MLFKAHQTVLMIGDSITDAGRTQGTGEWGQGYVRMVRALLLASCPELNLKVINRGVSGDSVRDLSARWEQDVTAHQPDWVSIKIGVNDVWRAFAGQPDLAVPPEEYQERLSGLLDRTIQAGGQPLLMTPFLVEPNRAESMRQRVEHYAGLMTALGRERQIPVVELQPAFDAAAEVTHPGMWAPDRVHPSDAGHGLIALQFLRKVGAPILSGSAD
ncbi:SGNH/GDSL hydrolase family protein [Deinococcus deserti]|uniref:Putative Hypolipase/acylhydrolase family protein n=1 Tax=Deinococcus deserti (strain DSM 17065 / CIP 109153 / LMG 22923 / VCD115) TaxID=546414 RepID=C1CZT8_DEIDV|nr:SGNH/GDSL hydrolase family protein [Deinococcus deserti]ACO45190.1 putative Hypolipase/acylhydrolase family protein [Deinococcus deserti VCD115]